MISYPTITATDLANAWVYAKVHPDEIELAIAHNKTIISIRLVYGDR